MALSPRLAHCGKAASGVGSVTVADYHVHTELCGHAEGTMRASVEQALLAGAEELGFADHLPLPLRWEPGLSMTLDDLDEYVSSVQALSREYEGDLRIVLGVEADYFESAEEELSALLKAYPFEYVIGSVHFLSDGLGFDQLRHHAAYLSRGVVSVYDEYYRLLAKAAASGLFDVVGHFDLPKKFADRPPDATAIAAAARSALRAVAAADMAIEVNTAGRYAPVAELYPAADLLAEAAALSIPLTFGSDAHRPADVGRDFAVAVTAARAAGYTQTLRLSDRTFVDLPRA
jgi:histidinol-phosphatase (PHP family)